MSSTNSYAIDSMFNFKVISTTINKGPFACETAELLTTKGLKESETVL
jgi:hypothetical protein